jgi:type IV secretory pathway VirD2 relaxase
MIELVKIVKKKFKDFDITSQHLGKVIRDNNLTRKRTRHEHFPVTRYGTPIEKQKELDMFYKKVDEYKLYKTSNVEGI